MKDKNKKERSKKILKFFIPVLSIAVLVILFLIIFNKEPGYVEAVEQSKADKAFNLLSKSLDNEDILYFDWIEGIPIKYGNEEIKAAADVKDGEAKADYSKGVKVLKYLEYAEYDIIVPEEGYYNIILDYKPESNTLSDYKADIVINGDQPYVEMKNIAFPLYWKDETKDFPVDRYGDETAPYQKRQDVFTSIYLNNSSYYTADPLLFYLKEGHNNIKITNTANDGLALGSLKAVLPSDLIPSYEEYKNTYKNEKLINNETVSINAVDYVSKNTTNAVFSSIDNPVLTPHEVEYKKLNVLTWTGAGSEVSYDFEVKESGLYHIALHYQNKKEDFSVFQTIQIDGSAPFKELVNYEFAATDTSWSNETLCDKDKEPYLIYLTKGTHTMTFRAEQEPIVKAWRYARLISEHVTQFDLAIKKIIGPEKDKDRTWVMTKYIPEIPDYLEAYETLLDYITYILQDYAPNGASSAVFSDLNKVRAMILKMKKYPDEIALYTDNLSGRDNSVIVSMGNFLTRLYEQKFSLDMVYIYGEQKLPRENAGFFKSLYNVSAGLVNTFTTNKFKQKNESEVLNIWVNRAMTHVDLLQKMADTEFTPKTGIKVKISVMPDANKLTMSVAAGEAPDIALGLSSHLPFELSSRGALYDMSSFSDFWEIAERFAAGSMTAYVYNEGVYAVPETLNFHALVYRKDIFNSLGLKIPDTWDDVRDILPNLQRYGMNFYHNISAGVGYKWFYQTAALIFQHNGTLYTEDGLRAAIDQPNAVKGIKELSDFFLTYSLEKQVISFFNSFRYGTHPIGIVDLDTYILIKNAAPELAEQWELALYPGTVGEDGEISRWYVANGTSGVIFEDTTQADDAWEFLKWWTSHSVQVSYAHTLQSTYGASFLWLSSNLEAVADSTFPQKDKMIIMEQVKWVMDVTRTPGQYILERSLSDIWNAMTNDGTPAQVAIDEKVIAINREILKKMNELGYYDEEGNMIKSYKTHDVSWIEDNIKKAKKGGN